jgi:hypothetical protein
MVKPILFAAALLSVCAAANPLAKNDNGNNGNGNGNGNNGNGNGNNGNNGNGNGNGNGNNGNGNGNGKGNNGKGNKSSSTSSSVSLSTTFSTSSSTSQPPSSTLSSSTLTLSSSTSTSSTSISSSSSSTSSSSTSTSPAPISTSTSSAPVSTSVSSGSCFNATIRKEFLLQITTYQPYDPYKSDVNNVNQIRLHIADPTNQNQNAITCTDARWNSTNQPFPSDYLTCDDPSISYKLVSWTDNSTFSLIINQTFVQDSFSETVLASYNATKSDLNGYACYANQGCSAYYQNVRTHPLLSCRVHGKPLTYFSQGGQGHALVYDVQKNGPPSTAFPEQCPPAPLPHPDSWPVRYASYAPEDPTDTSQPVARYILFDLLTDAQQGRRIKCTGPAWDAATESAQPADWYPCPYISYIPGNWSFRVESYTDYHTFNLGIKQHICNEVQCQDNLAYANMTTATEDAGYSACLGGNKCSAETGFVPVTAPIYAVANLTVIE